MKTLVPKIKRKVLSKRTSSSRASFSQRAMLGSFCAMRGCYTTAGVTHQRMDWRFSAAKNLARARYGGMNGTDACEENA